MEGEGRLFTISQEGVLESGGARKHEPSLAGREVRAFSVASRGSVTLVTNDELPPPPDIHPGRCARPPPGRVSWHRAENKQRSAPVAVATARSGRGRVGGVTCGLGVGVLGAGPEGTALPALSSDILRIAAPGLPRWPGSDSSWQRAARSAEPETGGEREGRIKGL